MPETGGRRSALTSAITRKVGAGLAIALVILAAVGSISYQMARQQTEAAGRLRHSGELLVRLSQLRADLHAAESAQRGYVLTGDSTFVRLVDSSRLRIEGGILGLRAQLADRPDQRARLGQLEPVAARRMAGLDSLRRRFETEGLSGAVRETQGGMGARAMADVRRRIDEMIDYERDIQDAHAGEQVGLARRTRSTIVAGVVLALILAAGTYEVIRRDIADRNRLQAELDRIFNLSRDLIAVAGLDGYLKRVNPAFVQLGYAEEELLARPLLEFIHPADVAPTAAELRTLAEGAPGIEFENRWLLKDGSFRWLAWKTSPPAPDGLIYVTARDVTDRRSLEEELRRTSLIDPLTGVYNRRGFLTLGRELLPLAERLGRGVVLVYTDVDDFKAINDTFGHAEGDRALVAVAKAFRSVFRKSDLVARLGGDEFTALAIGDPRETPDLVRARLASRIAELNARPGRPYDLSLSIGIAHFAASPMPELEEMLAEADRELYAEKRKRRATASHA